MKENEITEKLTKARTLIDECLDALGSSKKSEPKKQPVKRQKLASASGEDRTLSFSVNERAFVKANVKSLSGPKKFVLLIAYEAKGKVGVDVSLDLIRTKWNRMTSKDLLGYKFNLQYPTTAKTNGWIDLKQAGHYHLTSEWKKIFD